MEFESQNRTELSSLGEFGLIKQFRAAFTPKQTTTLMGIGDDAAVIQNSNTPLAITSDLLLEGVHFDLRYVPLKHLGYKAVVVNLSDICAMNAIPKKILVNLGVSNRFSLEAIEELYAGIQAACQFYNIDLIGGDTSASQQGLMLSVTSIGETQASGAVYRSTAKEHDLVCVSGDLGAAYMGLQILEREKSVFLANPKMQPELEGFDYLIQRQLKPEARIDIINGFIERGIIPTAMMDISDGLASELLHICNESKVGIRLYEDKIPIDSLTFNTALQFNLDPTVCALSGGEDYELLFTIPQSAYEKLSKWNAISVIGHVTSAHAGCEMIAKDGTQHPIQAQGWKAF